MNSSRYEELHLLYLLNEVYPEDFNFTEEMLNESPDIQDEYHSIGIEITCPVATFHPQGINFLSIPHIDNILQSIQKKTNKFHNFRKFNKNILLIQSDDCVSVYVFIYKYMKTLEKFLKDVNFLYDELIIYLPQTFIRIKTQEDFRQDITFIAAELQETTGRKAHEYINKYWEK